MSAQEEVSRRARLPFMHQVLYRVGRTCSQHGRGEMLYVPLDLAGVERVE